MANKKGQAKAKSGVRPQSAATNNPVRKTLQISVEDQPLLLHGPQGELIAGIKLESVLHQNGCVTLSGWALGSNRLSLSCAGKEVVAQLKELPRADVLAAFAVGSGFPPGFELATAMPMQGQLTLHWIIAVDDSQHVLDLQLADDNSLAKPHDAATGALDHLLNDWLYGWAWDPSHPDGKTKVEFLLDDAVVGEIVCDKFRQDLQEAGIGDGKHGFSWPVPHTIEPADACRLVVRIAGTSTLLAGVLKASYSTLSATHCYDGELDFAWPHYVAGSLFPRTQPLPEFLEVLINDEAVCQLGITRVSDPSGKHGKGGSFHWQVPAILAQIPAAEVAVRLPGQRLLGLALVQDQAALSKKTTAAPVNTTRHSDIKNPVHGMVERLSSAGVEGWAWDASRPDVPIDLAIRVDGEVVGTTRANRFAARLRSDERNGHQYFSFVFPATLQNGHKREVTVEDISTGVVLPAKHKLVSFPLVSMQSLIDQAPASNRVAVFTPARHSTYAQRVVKPLAAKRSSSVSGVRVSMLMLNWNGASMLEDFLASLELHPPALRYELLIVDHGSADKSKAVIKRYSKILPIRLIERGANYSYASSNNLAARAARGEYLLFLNNDLVLQQDCTTAMAEILADPSIGIVGARLLEPLKEAGDSWAFAAHHEGVRFKVDSLPDTATAYYAPQELFDVPAEQLGSVLKMPAVTAAVMMCRKSEFLAAGGFCEDYFYGMEDVDFCLGFANKTGKQIVCALNVTAIHNRSATRELKLGSKQPKAAYNAATHLDNRRTYIRRHGRALSRQILTSLLSGETFYRQHPLRVTFAVTKANLNTPAGDFFTALELGSWLHKKFGWEIYFVEKDNYAIPGTDVLVAMRHDFELRRIEAANPGLITVAWIRNRTEEWLARPEFAAYNLVFASSQLTVEHVRTAAQRDAILLPIATNPERFTPDKADADYASDVVFTGNNHGVARSAIELLDLKKADFSFAIYGHQWDESKKFRRYNRGPLPYDQLAKVYASAKVVIDDAHPVTRDWHSLNSRVFDAIASGKVVLTNCVGGAKELFGNKLPVFTSADELNKTIKALLKDDRKREKLAQELRKLVLAKHTYAHRADTFKRSLATFLKPRMLRFAIKAPVPSAVEREQWGDYHFALGIKRALERKGHNVRIDLLPDWYSGTSASDEVVIVLRGLSRYQPQPTAINLMWLISHPEAVTVEELQAFDHVFVASESCAEKFASTLGSKVSCLLQCTDQNLFYPDPDKSLKLPDVLFVGNSRKQKREAVSFALDSGVNFGVYGSLWQGIVPQGRILGEYIPNNELRRYYSTAKVLLNDHWPDMKAQGFISNRIFDAGACGAVIVTDAVAGLETVLGKTTLVYDCAQTFNLKLVQAMTDVGLRKKMSLKISKAVLAHHTFDHRMLAVLAVTARFISFR